MAFPTTSALDTFNAGALQNLTARAGWSALVVRSGKATCATDAVPTYATLAAGSGSNVWGSTFAANQECWAVLSVVPSDINLYVRLATDGTTTTAGYLLQVVPGANGWKIFNHNFVGQIGSSGTQAVSNGDSIGIGVSGTAITAYYRSGAGSWTTIISTSSSNSNGTGLIAFDSTDSGTMHLDTFGGGATLGSLGSGSMMLLGVGA